MSEVERPPIVLVNRCVILDDTDRILLIKRSSNDNNYPGLWELPGGKLEAGEDVPTARANEMKQETGLTVDLLSSLQYVDSFLIEEGKYAGLPYIGLYSVASVVGGKLQLSNEHEDSVWTSYRSAWDYELTPESAGALRALGDTLLRIL